MRSLTSEVYVTAVTSYVCGLYGFDTSDINEARYKAFMRLSGGGKQTQPLARIKKISCASLPPCSQTLVNRIKRANFVAKIWKRADQVDPTGGECPFDYGWINSINGFQPFWFTGSPVPESLTRAAAVVENEAQSVSNEHAPEKDSESVWSEDSDDSDEDDNF